MEVVFDEANKMTETNYPPLLTLQNLIRVLKLLVLFLDP